MKLLTPFLALAALCASVSAEDKNLFNGKDLTGWKGLDFWSVKDGTITGQTTKEHPTKGNTFLVWDGEVADFELTFQYKIVDLDGKSDKFGNSGVQYRSKVVDEKGFVVAGYQADFELTFQYKIVDENGQSAGFGNSGVQYRSKVVDEKGFVVAGYQGDFECGKTYSGILYEEKGRGILAKRGEKVVIREGKDAKKPKIEVVGSLGKTDEIQAKIKPADWNEYRIVAKGGHLQHFINGVQTIDVTDETAVGAKKGVLALQLHAGTPMTVQFKDLVLKEVK